MLLKPPELFDFKGSLVVLQFKFMHVRQVNKFVPNKNGYIEMAA